MAFDNQAQLDAISPIEHADLPTVWAVSRDHLIANALLGLGRPYEALDYAPDVEALDVPIPGAVVTRSQCLWAAGQPIEAIAAARGDHDRHGARDRFLGHLWLTAMLAWSGNVEASLQSRANRRGVLPSRS